ncbi:MAG: cell division protein FtsQ/DivIB [Mariprofundales bacterium]|nr:cell division protein FtsQ/DivIB [Mariprofundales bacterium]
MSRWGRGNRVKPAAVGWRQRIALPLSLLRRAAPVVLMVVAALAALQQLDGAMAVRSWQVVCDDQQLQQAIDEHLLQMSPIGFVAGSPVSLAQRLRSLEPDIAAVEVERHLPDRLRIHARMRQPVALWTGGGGRVMLVDEEGVIYRPLRRGEVLDLPLIRGAGREQLLLLVQLLNHLQREHPQRVAEMSELIAQGEMLRINLSRGAQWQCHLDSRVVARVDDIIALLSEEQWRHGIWRVDARQQDRWFVRAGNGEREVI